VTKCSGYNNNPIARCVKCIPKDYFLLTNRFICDERQQVDQGCGISWQGSDPHIIAQLPCRLSLVFPGLFDSDRQASSKIIFRSLHQCVWRYKQKINVSNEQHICNSIWAISICRDDSRAAAKASCQVGAHVL